ncbi:MAG: metalloregulator ArsR/SmtB family transcription factor [Phycisphaerae bacterium]
MVNRHSAIDRTFAALADPTRRAMLDRLVRGPAVVAQLARPFKISAPAVSKHLRVLERAGLLRQRRRGRQRHCVLRPAPLRAAASWIDRYRRYWSQQLDALAAFLESTAPDGPRASKTMSRTTKENPR